MKKFGNTALIDRRTERLSRAVCKACYQKAIWNWCERTDEQWAGKKTVDCPHQECPYITEHVVTLPDEKEEIESGPAVILLSDSDPDDWQFGEGNWTMDFWVKFPKHEPE